MRKRTTLLAALLALALLPACGQGSGPEPQVQEPPAQEEMQRETLRLELTSSAAEEDTLMQALQMLTELLPAALAEQGVAVRAGLHCAPEAHRSGGSFETGTVRVSFSAFNTQQEVLRFAQICEGIFSGEKSRIPTCYCCGNRL